MPCSNNFKEFEVEFKEKILLQKFLLPLEIVKNPKYQRNLAK